MTTNKGASYEAKALGELEDSLARALNEILQRLFHDG